MLQTKKGEIQFVIDTTNLNIPTPNFAVVYCLRNFVDLKKKNYLYIVAQLFKTSTFLL